MRNLCVGHTPRGLAAMSNQPYLNKTSPRERVETHAKPMRRAHSQGPGNNVEPTIPQQDLPQETRGNPCETYAQGTLLGAWQPSVSSVRHPASSVFPPSCRILWPCLQSVPWRVRRVCPRRVLSHRIAFLVVSASVWEEPIHLGK